MLNDEEASEICENCGERHGDVFHIRLATVASPRRDAPVVSPERGDYSESEDDDIPTPPPDFAYSDSLESENEDYPRSPVRQKTKKVKSTKADVKKYKNLLKMLQENNQAIDNILTPITSMGNQLLTILNDLKKFITLNAVVFDQNELVALIAQYEAEHSALQADMSVFQVDQSVMSKYSLTTSVPPKLQKKEKQLRKTIEKLKDILTSFNNMSHHQSNIIGVFVFFSHKLLTNKFKSVDLDELVTQLNAGNINVLPLVNTIIADICALNNHCCVICSNNYSNPVVASDGHVYCRDCITKWNNERSNKSPMTREKLKSTLYPIQRMYLL